VRSWAPLRIIPRCDSRYAGRRNESQGDRDVVLERCQRRRIFAEDASHEGGDLPFGQFPPPMDTRPQIQRRGEQRIFNRQDNQAGDEVFRKRRRVVERARRRFRIVDGTQD
jgi:hypothetical protein